MLEVKEMSLLYRVTVLVDNHVLGAREDLEAEHGLSMYVETPDNAFLFDCGHTGMAWNNAKTLGVDLSSVKHVEHGYYFTLRLSRKLGSHMGTLFLYAM